MMRNDTSAYEIKPYRVVCIPTRERRPAVAINSIEAAEDAWCRSRTVAAPVPALPVTTKFPPIATVLRLDICDWTSLDIAILSIWNSTVSIQVKFQSCIQFAYYSESIFDKELREKKGKNIICNVNL